MKDINLISEYWSDDQSRKAEIRLDDQGYYVILKVNDQVEEIRDLFEHSLRYAEDCCENFVMKWGAWADNDIIQKD